MVKQRRRNRVRCRRRWRQQVVMDRGGICWDQSHMVTGRVNEGTFGVGIAVAAIGGQMVVPSFVEVLICDEAGNHMQYTHMQSARNRVHSAYTQHALSMHSACNQILTQIRHPSLVEAEELQSVVNTPDDEGGNQTHSDTIRQPPDILRLPPSAWPGDGREMVGRWSGDGRERCTFQGVPSSFRPADGVGSA